MSSATNAGGLYWTDIDADVINNGGVMCNMLPTKNGADAWESSTPCIMQGDFSATRKGVRIYCHESNIASFKAAYAGLQIAYKLATPITLTLTPSMLKLLEGYNYITADGEMSMVYIPESILPTAPTTDGTYRLICTVANGVPTFSWVAN